MRYSNGIAALAVLACILFPAITRGQTKVTAPLVLECVSTDIAVGSSVAPWVRCPNYRWNVPRVTTLVATDSSTTGTWQRYGDISPTRLIRACPSGSLLSTTLRDCLTGTGGAYASVWLPKSQIEAAQPPVADRLAQVLLVWEPATMNTDGSTLAFPTLGYGIYHGTAPDALTKIDEVLRLNYAFTALTPGTHYFAVSQIVEDPRCKPGLPCGPAVRIESPISAVLTKVIAAPEPVTVSLSVSPADGIESVIPALTWSSRNADACVASGGWTGAKPINGSETQPAIAASATYTLTCTRADQSAVATAMVAVSPRPAAPRMSLQ